MKYLNKIILLLIIINSNLFSQSTTGMTGLISIPVADINKDRTLSIGTSYIDRHITDYAEGVRDILNVYANITYLPFLEIGARITRQLNYSGDSHVVDRMFSFRLKLFNESMYLPSLAVGANNPYSTLVDANHFNSTYIVVTKNIPLKYFLNNLSFTIGYGSDLIEASDYQFIGIFGGGSITLLNETVDILMEYDAERFNAGLRLNLFEHIKILGGLMDRKYFSGGIALFFQL